MRIKEIARIVGRAFNNPRRKKLYIDNRKVEISSFFEIPIRIGIALQKNKKIKLVVGDKEIIIN